MIKKFDEFLAAHFSVDYWSDEGIGIAEEILYKFEDSDWNKLFLICEDRNEEWLIKLCEVLGENYCDSAVKVLLKLANSDDFEVKIAALDSMNSLLALSNFDDESLEKIRSILRKTHSSSNVSNLVIDSLKMKLI